MHHATIPLNHTQQATAAAAAAVKALLPRRPCRFCVGDVEHEAVGVEEHPVGAVGDGGGDVTRSLQENTHTEGRGTQTAFK